MPLERSQIITFLKTIHPFRKMGDPQLSLIANYIKEEIVSEERAIYKQGDDSEYIYILYSGSVSLTRQREDEVIEFGKLKPGDIFGFEVLRRDNSRKATATANTASTLLYLNTDALDLLEDQIPPLKVFNHLMSESFRVAMRTHLEWRNEEEPIHFVGFAHPIFFWRRMILPVLAAILVLGPLLYLAIAVFSANIWALMFIIVVGLVIAAWVAWIYLDWINDFHIITDRRVVLQERVLFFYDSRIEMPFDAIISVNSSTTYWGRIFSYGQVVLNTINGILTFNNLEQPTQIASMIEERLARSNTGKVQSDKSAKVDLVRQRLGLVTPSPKTAGAVPPTALQMDSLQEWLASKFEMRSEKNGVIIYRTHWFILFKRIWAPTLLLIGLPIFLIIYLAQLLPMMPLPVALGIMIIWLISASAWWTYEYMDWSNDQYLLSDDQVVDIYRKPFGQEEKRAAPLKNIQSVEFKRLGLSGLLLNFGTVFLRIGEDKFTFDFVYNPSEVQREIFHRIARRKQKDKQMEMEGERQRMLDWLEAYHRATGPSDAAPAAVPPKTQP